jgi:hypothetical protein
MLTAHALVIRDNHIARLETVFAVTFYSIADHVSQIRDEMRHTTDVLAQQAAPGIEQTAAVVTNLVNHHVVRSPLQHVRHLIRDRGKHVPDNFERDNVQFH